MTAPSTFDLYRKLAVERPAKARRYLVSINETLAAGVGELEAERLREALEGIAAGLAEHPTCERCGRELSDPESIARGFGPDCAELVASVAR